MDTAAPPRIRLLAMIGMLAAVALAGWFFLMSRSAGETAADPIPIPPAAVVKPKPAVTPKAKPVVAAKKKPAVAKAKAATPAKPKAAAKAKPKRRALIAPNGLPTAISDQLAKHRVVVAALYAGGAAVDGLARDEARAGARDARAGFAAVDVSDKRIATALAKKADVLSAPAVLVFVKGGEIKARLNGFADRLLVAELAGSAR